MPKKDSRFRVVFRLDEQARRKAEELRRKRHHRSIAECARMLFLAELDNHITGGR